MQSHLSDLKIKIIFHMQLFNIPERTEEGKRFSGKIYLSVIT